jgi:hypothetical protein
MKCISKVYNKQIMCFEKFENVYIKLNYNDLKKYEKNLLICQVFMNIFLRHMKRCQDVTIFYYNI